jgi:hypothetical protein
MCVYIYIRERIIAAVPTVDKLALMGFWQELDHHMYVCHVIRGIYIEYL